jgi:hypothetical protein
MRLRLVLPADRIHDALDISERVNAAPWAGFGPWSLICRFERSERRPDGDHDAEFWFEVDVSGTADRLPFTPGAFASVSPRGAVTYGYVSRKTADEARTFVARESADFAALFGDDPQFEPETP